MGRDKISFFDELEDSLKLQGWAIEARDDAQPWGGYFVIKEHQANYFAFRYFDIPEEGLKISGKVSPKILVVAPQRRLSFQYHHRRAEIWRVLKGPVGIVRSETDREGECKIFGPNKIIPLHQGERYRLVGLMDWGVLAALWLHTNKDYPSDDNDIVRVMGDDGGAHKSGIFYNGSLKF